MAESVKRGGQEGDYPSTGLELIRSMLNNIHHKCVIRGKYKIGFAGYDMLVVIIDRWINEHKGCTAYSLASEPRNSTISSTGLVINGLRYARLIEVTGKGKFSCNVYAPTKLALEAFGIVEAA